MLLDRAKQLQQQQQQNSIAQGNQQAESQEDPMEERSESPGQEQQEGQQGSQNDQGVGDVDIPAGEEATPEEEAELQRALGAFSAAVYKDDGTFNSVVKKLQNGDIPPINKLSDTTISLVTQIDKKINIDEGVILPFVSAVYEKIYEIAETARAFSLPEDILQKGLMVTVQLAIQAYGVSPEEYNEFAETIGQDGAAKLINYYKQNGGGIQNEQHTQ